MNVIILGASGSIGTQTLEVIKEEKLNLVGCSLGRDLSLAKRIIDEYNPSIVCLREKSTLVNEYPNVKFVYGNDGLLELARYKCDIVVNALMGSVGLKPTVEAIITKHDIALANKETLVMAGDIIMPLAKKYNVSIYPIDSEHSAIWQCLIGEDYSSIKKLIITASGGAFRDKTRDELVNVKKEDALNHPNWKMGEKITIDCATMMNKGLEVIEAHHLFNLPYDKIETIMHKESVVHSLVEFNDSSIKAQLAVADMKMPIRFALLRKRVSYDHHLTLSDMHFEELSFDRYPCLKYAYDAGIAGGIMPTVLNAVNEAAVKLFLDGKIRFLDIEKIVEKELLNYKNFNPTLDDIIRVDKEIKERLGGI